MTFPRRRRRAPRKSRRVFDILPRRVPIQAGLERDLWRDLVVVEVAEHANAYDSDDSPNRQRLQLLGLIVLSLNTFLGKHFWSITEAGRKARRSGRLPP